MSNNPVRIHQGWIKGALGWVIAEHGRYYETHWRLGPRFEARVAEAMGAWMNRYDPARDLLLLALDDEGLLGSISLDGSDPAAGEGSARIRFFIMAERARGRGVGRRLMRDVMAFAAGAGFSHIWLTTFRGLDAARSLYEDFGFVLTDEKRETSWGTPLDEQRFDWRRNTAGGALDTADEALGSGL